jgi:hypothetical protein
MSDKFFLNYFPHYDWLKAAPVFRYAVGSTMILAFSAGFGSNLSYIIPVLALNFFAPGVPQLSVKNGLGLVISLGIACFLAFILSRVFLDFPMVFIPLLGLALLHIYYSGSINPVFRIWLIVAFLVIPLLCTYSHKLGALVSITLVTNAFQAVVLVLLIFMIFPSGQSSLANIPKTAVKVTPGVERFDNAIRTMIVIFPVVILFYAFQWSGSLLILIFIALLSLKPQSANFKGGLMMILANLAGGLAAIIAFNVFTIVPEYIFLILVTLFVGLLFGQQVYSGKPTSTLYGTAFSTYLLVLGSVTSSEGEAGEKVWMRILQIGIAVTYVVVAFGICNHFIQPKKKM